MDENKCIRIYYAVNDYYFNLAVNQVSKLEKVIVDGQEDYKIYFDSNKFSILLSDIIKVKDFNGDIHKDNILEFLKNNKMIKQYK